MRLALIYSTALVVLVAAAYLIWTRAPRLEEPAMATTTPAVEMTVTEWREETDTYSMDVRYPQFGLEAVDMAVRGTVENAIAAFKSYPVDDPPIDSIPKNEQIISFNSVYTGSDYVSVALVVSEYTGGAHPNSVIIGVNVDKRSGLEVTLEGALSLVGKSLEEVAAEVSAELSAKLSEAFFEEGATPIEDNYSTFLVSDDEVTFVFNNYQVAPYAAGPQMVAFARVDGE